MTILKPMMKSISLASKTVKFWPKKKSPKKDSLTAPFDGAERFS